jgi:4-aminobutyrate aminotransferase/(S)-3-amino-2-methylpropionate transaminase
MRSDLGELAPAMRVPIPGPRSRALVEVLAETECPSLTARRQRRAEASGAAQDPIVWTEARGANVVDADGNVLVDMVAGFGAASIGHGHPAVVRAIREQSERLIHALGDVHPSDVKIELCERLAKLAPFADARVILGAHGGDAIEAALKTAMLATKKPGVLAFRGSYHGLAHAPLAISGYADRFRAPFAAQLNPHVTFEAYGASTDAIATRLSRGDVGCVVVEPILGRGGVVVPPEGWLAAVAEVTREAGALLVVDEIMTGLGRTGSRLACDRQGVVPDVLCLGKALGGGMPVSACLAPHHVMAHWGTPDQESIHTATFFGQPLACAAALAALDVIDEEALAERAVEMGGALEDRLRALARRHACIADVRGRGLLLGVVLRRPAAALRVSAALLGRGFITLAAGADASVLSLTPPLTIATAQVDAFVDALDAVLGAEDAA